MQHSQLIKTFLLICVTINLSNTEDKEFTTDLDKDGRFIFKHPSSEKSAALQQGTQMPTLILYNEKGIYEDEWPVTPENVLQVTMALVEHLKDK